MAFLRSETQDWIFVTGMIRSGTTFLGKLLTLPLSVDYIHEPFHGGYSLPDRRPFQPRYLRPDANGPKAREFRDHVKHLFNYQFGLSTTHHPDDSLLRKVGKRLVGSRGPAYLRIARLNPFHRKALIKDPVARLTTEYLYHTFDITPVIIVRHPVSLAASLERVGWYPEMDAFLNEPDLLEDFFSSQPDFLRRDWPSRLLESMGHWRATYHVLLSQAEKYSNWHVVTHEELCKRPLSVSRQLYEALELPWSSLVKYRIRRLTGGGSPEARSGQAMDLKRDSSNLFEMRRDSIPEEKRREIFDIVKDVALELYPRDSFAID